MGGHGGLNILPQKRWNVYNFDNREKVRKDEEEAAKEEQLKREQSRKRDTEFRIEQLRQARGLASASASASASSSRKPTAVEPESVPSPKAEPEPELEPKSKHINLFEGIKILDPVEIVDKSKSKFSDENRKGFKRMKKEAEVPKVVLPEDEKYRLGYGVAGKGVKLPWYMEKRANGDAKGVDNNDDDGGSETVTKSNRKKSVAELREERLKREGREKERVRALMQQKGRRGALVQNDRGYSRRDSWK
ncbi:putative CBF1-interacting co-repressor CIR domain-containing protein [Helianthus annuus]|nr:putative CBF1-interacting co-repressor CIR domain-containing protein [Helianthus annuus]